VEAEVQDVLNIQELLTSAEQETAKTWAKERERIRHFIAKDAWIYEGIQLHVVEIEKRMAEYLASHKRERDAEYHARRMVQRCSEISGMPKDANVPGGVPLVKFNAYARFMSGYLNR
jgi:ribosomal protein S19